MGGVWHRGGSRQPDDGRGLGEQAGGVGVHANGVAAGVLKAIGS